MPARLHSPCMWPVSFWLCAVAGLFQLQSLDDDVHRHDEVFLHEFARTGCLFLQSRRADLPMFSLNVSRLRKNRYRQPAVAFTLLVEITSNARPPHAAGRRD